MKFLSFLSLKIFGRIPNKCLQQNLNNQNPLILKCPYKDSGSVLGSIQIQPSRHHFWWFAPQFPSMGPGIQILRLLQPKPKKDQTTVTVFQLLRREIGLRPLGMIFRN